MIRIKCPRCSTDYVIEVVSRACEVPADDWNVNCRLCLDRAADLVRSMNVFASVAVSPRAKLWVRRETNDERWAREDTERDIRKEESE